MIVVEHVAGLATIQDLGRAGFMHEGLAAGGALVPELLVDANRALGNGDDAPCLEVFGRIRVRFEASVTIANEARVVAVAAGADRQIESGVRRVTYLAIHGGFAAPVICGGRGTQLSAGIGAALRAGDRLACNPEGAGARSGGDSRGTARTTFADDGSPIQIVGGPDQIAGAVAALLAGDYRIAAASDRVGTRLDGPALPASAASGVSRPMVRGAIELPPDGRPIVLGPEHPTTGGYPVIAVVATREQGRLFSRPPGAAVRFTVAVAR